MYESSLFAYKDITGTFFSLGVKRTDAHYGCILNIIIFDTYHSQLKPVLHCETFGMCDLRVTLGAIRRRMAENSAKVMRRKALNAIVTKAKYAITEKRLPTPENSHFSDLKALTKGVKYRVEVRVRSELHQSVGVIETCWRFDSY